MGEYENIIIELYDNCPKRHQIKSIAEMYNTSVDEVEAILTTAGREIPKPGRPKMSTKAAEPQNDKVEERHEAPVAAMNVPEAVRVCVVARISELNRKKTEIETELKTLTDFIDAVLLGNLSQ